MSATVTVLKPKTRTHSAAAARRLIDGASMNWRTTVIRCQRCHARTDVHTMSMFDTAIICMVCKEIETKHPRYAEAVAAECSAVQSGNLNFPGIGKPEDL